MYDFLLSHEYYELTERDVFDVSKRIGIVKGFAEKIKELLRTDNLGR